MLPSPCRADWGNDTFKSGSIITGIATMLSEVYPADCGRWCLLELMVTERMFKPSLFPIISKAVPKRKLAGPCCVNVLCGTSVPQ